MILSAGTIYTFKMNASKFFLFGTSENDVKERSALMLSGIATVQSVERPFGMRYYLVRIEPYADMQSEKIATGLRDALNQLGFDNASLIDIEKGETTTNAFKETVKAAAEGISPISDTLIKIVAGLVLAVSIGAAVYFTIRRKT